MKARAVVFALAGAGAFGCSWVTMLPAQMTGPAATGPAIAPIVQLPVAFDDFFVDKALRLEMYQVGDAKTETVTLHEIYEEPVWPENPRSLIPPFELGHYAVRMVDVATNRLIFQKNFDTMFAEYRTTTPAINGESRVFEKVIRIPEPKKPGAVTFERRDKFHTLSPEFATTIDPADYHILRETVNRGDWTFEVQKSGDPHSKVDLAFIAEGYTAEDKDKFKGDTERMINYFFTVEPYKSNKDKFNVYGVFRPSAERRMDEPRQKVYRSTVLNSHYNSFDLDRYLLTEDAFTLHRLAGQVPCDAVIILVNSNRYGGGSICLDYCIASVDGPTAPRILVHEFGHSFAALADEYVGSVAYNDMYPPGVEPLEPNITELLDPANLKWKQYLTPGIALPTPDATAEVRALQQQVTAARDAGDAAKLKEAQDKMAVAVARVGAFEGAGYLAKGMYRPQLRCIMGTAGPTDGFCVVCQAGIQRMIDYYAAGAAIK